MRLPFVSVSVAGAVSLAAMFTPGAPAHVVHRAHPATVHASSARPALTPGDWTGFRDQPWHAGVNTAETMLGHSTVAGLHVLSSIASQDNEITSQAGATGHGLLFAGTRSGGIAAYDESTGAPRWSATPGSDDIAVGPAAVYTVSHPVSGSTGAVTAYDAATGTRLWQLPLTSVDAVNPPTLVGGRLYVTYATTGATNVVLDLNATTGRLGWQRVIDQPEIPSSAAIGSGLVILTTGNDMLIALDTHTGAIRWSHTSSGAGIPSAEPVVVNGVVYSGFADGTVRAYTASTGALLWSRNLGGAIFGALAMSNGLLYATPSAASGPDLVALRIATGATAWSVTGAVATSSPTVANGVVYVSTTAGSAELKAYAAATGALLAQVPLSQTALSEAMVSHGRVYVRVALGTTEVLGS